MYLNLREIKKRDFFSQYFTNSRHTKIGNKEKFAVSKYHPVSYGPCTVSKSHLVYTQLVEGTALV